MTDTPLTPATHARTEIARTPRLTWRAYVARAIAGALGFGLVKMGCDGYAFTQRRGFVDPGAYDVFSVITFAVWCIAAVMVVAFTCGFFFSHINERK